MIENLEDVFVYDESSKTGLRWKIDRFWGKLKVATAGEEVGSPDYRGESFVLRFNNKLVKAHHIVLILNGFEIKDGMVVDHVDGNPLNNRISNLRIVTSSENARNRAKPSNNTSGFVGVTLWKDQRGSEFWSARWVEDGKRFQKIFSIAKYGSDGAFELAREHRIKMLSKLNELGYGYTERHGK